MSNTIEWESLIPEPIYLEVQTKTIKPEGRLVYEYNPFRNYRLSENKYFYNNLYYSFLEAWDENLIITKYLVPNNEEQLEEKSEEDLKKLNYDIKERDIRDNHVKIWSKDNQEYTFEYTQEYIEGVELYEKGQLVDFITEELKFSLEHPVHIIPQPSYDGSVNLIINDGINIPRLINSRFSPTGKNTYKIVDRAGTNDTNIYDEGPQFDIDTSLYKRISKIPKIKYLGTESSGNLKVGNYYFYFKLADDDGNESDFIGESGLVSIFIGYDYPSSIHTGNKNQNSYKAVKFYLDNLDESYNYIKVYYSRATSENGLNSFTEYKKIERKFAINKANSCNLLISGFDVESDITALDLNLHYNIVDSVKSSTVCLNMLFMANIHKPDLEYKELEDLSLRFLPYLHEENYIIDINEKYNINSSSKGYYDSKFIYEKVGYWGEELYRLGIVYILPNNELTPVFNIRGGINLNDESIFSEYPLIQNNQRNYIESNDLTNYIITTLGANVLYENTKGVISFAPSKDANTIYGINIVVDVDTINELKKYVKGYFFVRQTRIPFILAQGITLGIDLTSFTPCIPTAKGVLDELNIEENKKTHIDTSDITGLNYISEGFLTRYRYYFKRKSSNIWKTIGTVALVAVAVTALVAATVVTAGGVAAVATSAAASLTTAATATGVTAATATAMTAAAATLTATASALTAVSVGTAALVSGAVGAVAVLGTTVAAALQLASINSHHQPQEFRGRETPTPPDHRKVEEDNSRILSHEFLDRIIIKDQSKVKVLAILCPDYTINQVLYNQMFTGNVHNISYTTSQNIYFNSTIGNYFENKDRHFYIPEYTDYEDLSKNYYLFKIKGVGEGVKLESLDNLKFRSKAGQAEEAWKYECVGDDYKSDYAKVNDEEDNETINNKQINSDIIRGIFSPYLAFNDTNNTLKPASTVNIYIPNYNKNDIENYIKIRINDSSVYNTISDRIDINDVIPKSLLVNDDVPTEINHLVFRGDCYLCQFTLRLNRNFNDPSAPYNDEIVDSKSWKNNYDTIQTEKLTNINLGDVNAVQLGMWVTFRIRSSNNLNIRTLDGSNVDETEMTGHEKGYYPYNMMSVEGTYKHSDSQIYNKGFSKSVGDRWHFMSPDVPHIKNWFGTRIMHSDIHINDAFRNGFRVFQGLNYRDYTREYGEITKIVAFESSLLCVFEHGIALIPVNERALASKGTGGNIYVTTSSVLPENPKIISDSYGSQWADSILKVPGTNNNLVYGVDTIAKKIWVTDGNSIDCISDMKVLEFLNNNITLGERELAPKLGIRNVKTVYNAFKKDVMFTFYDDTYGHDEKVWNLCYNETLLKFITFYSWVPSFMENINNIPFSFNRTTSKLIAKLGTSLKENNFSDGITIDNVYCDKFKDSSEYSSEEYCKVGNLSLTNRILPKNLSYEISYELLNYKDIFKIEKETQNNVWVLKCKKKKLSFVEGGLYSEFYYRNKAGNSYADDLSNLLKYEERIILDKNGAIISEISDEEYMKLPIFKNKGGKRITRDYDNQINPDNVVMLLDIKAIIKINTEGSESMSLNYYNQLAGYESGTTLIDAGYYESTVAVTTTWNMQFLSTDFWKHGQAGIFDISDDIHPTDWYGKTHPFEFEVLVVGDPAIHKIFTNLEIIANKALPESFHYEIVGESYDFAKDKINMFIKLEAIKHLWQYNGQPISYDRTYLKCLPTYQKKSADFIKKYYYRHDSFNEVEDYYLSNISESEQVGKDHRHLAGAETVYYPNRQEYRIWNHAPAINLNDLEQENARSLIASNCQYKEDRWLVNINPIILCYKNEYIKNSEDETNFKLKLPLLNSQIPDEMYNKDISSPLDFNNKFDIDMDKWGNRKEIDLKDKFIKIRVRYSGKDLVVINALNTIYKESYG